MRPEPSNKTVSIRNRTARTDSGSVSPPAPLPKMNAVDKSEFFARMRQTFKKEMIPPEVLEGKIEKLWTSLTPTQKANAMKINTSGVQKENFQTKKPSPTPSIVIPRIPVLQRRSNCKAIAKVLDLRSDLQPQKNQYAENLKMKMKAYSMEASMASRKTTGISTPPPPKPFVDVPDTHLSPEKIKKMIVEPEMPVKETVPKLPSPPPPAVRIQIPRIAPKTTIVRRLTRPAVVVRSLPPPVPKLTKVQYQEACDKYLRTLAQANLTSSDQLDKTSLQRCALIAEGVSLVREYSFGEL